MLNRLKLDHDHLLRKLNLLEMQFKDMCRGKVPDYALMRSIIVYVQEYPERIHHPLEDMIFSILLERAGETKVIQDLITEHTELEVVTRKLRDSLEPLPSGTGSEETLKQQLSAFLVVQRNHIYMEEVEVYPLVQSFLTKDDWSRLQFVLPVLDDPIFGRPARSDYERLYREIEDKSNSMLHQTEAGNLKVADFRL